ncbi:MAG: hypothetical protein OHK003_13410 [Anaerolineales bacterium]
MDENADPFEVRMGTFFVVMGAGTFLLFVISDVSDKVDFDYFFISMILLAIGYYLRRSKAPPPPSGRFAWFKGFWGKLRAGRGGGGGKDKKG